MPHTMMTHKSKTQLLDNEEAFFFNCNLKAIKAF